MSRKPNQTKGTAAKALRALALRYPEAREEFPWGERGVKVRKKVFVFMGSGDGDFGLSVKLPQSAGMALMLPFAEPTGYGLGKSGWVTATFTSKQKPPVPLLAEWIDESYRAIAPKNLVATLPPVGPDGPSSAGPRTGRPGSNRTGGRSSRSTGRAR